MSKFLVGTRVVHRGGEIVRVVAPPSHMQWERETPEVQESWAFVRKGDGEVVMALKNELRPYLGHGAGHTRSSYRGTTHCPHCGVDYPHVHDRKGFPHASQPSA